MESERQRQVAPHYWMRQGTYSDLQCLRSCTTDVWDARPYMEGILPKINLETGELTDPSLVLACPRCGGDVSLNVRGGSWFAKQPYEDQAPGFKRWFTSTARGRLALLDIGTGLSTPSVVRWPMEHIAASRPNVQLIRVNPDHPQIDPKLEDRSTSIRLGAADFLTEITLIATAKGVPPHVNV